MSSAFSAVSEAAKKGRVHPGARSSRGEKGKENAAPRAGSAATVASVVKSAGNWVGLARRVERRVEPWEAQWWRGKVERVVVVGAGEGEEVEVVAVLAAAGTAGGGEGDLSVVSWPFFWAGGTS